MIWKRGIWGSLMVLMALAFPWAARAQGDLIGRFVTEDGSMAFNYPEGWVARADTAGVAALGNSERALMNGQPMADDVIMMFFSPEFLEELGGDPSTLEGALDGFQSMIEADRVGAPMEVTIGEREGLAILVNFEDVHSLAVALMLSDGVAGVATASTTGALADFADTTQAVMATWDRPDAQSGAQPAESQAAESQSAPAEPCEVSTQDQWSASLRVGPGENRSELTTLAAGQWFPVTGRAEADDGSLWWQLDKAAVAPQSAAAELWVSQAQVDERGGCDQVGTADAPPIIPITVVQPTAVPAPGQPAATAAPVKPGSGGTGIWIEFPEWNAQLPPEMKATSPATARLVVTVLPSLTPVASESYFRGNGSTTTVYRMRVDYTVTALDPKTNAVLGTNVMQGGDPPGFPNSMPINATLNGPAPEFSSALVWMQGFLQ